MTGDGSTSTTDLDRALENIVWAIETLSETSVLDSAPETRNWPVVTATDVDHSAYRAHPGSKRKGSKAEHHVLNKLLRTRLAADILACTFIVMAIFLALVILG